MKHILALLLIKLGTLALIAINVFMLYWGFQYMGFSPFWALFTAVTVLALAEHDDGWRAWKALRHPFSRYWSRSN